MRVRSTFGGIFPRTIFVTMGDLSHIYVLYPTSTLAILMILGVIISRQEKQAYEVLKLSSSFFFLNNSGVRDFTLTNPRDPCKAPPPNGSSTSPTFGPRKWPQGIGSTQ